MSGETLSELVVKIIADSKELQKALADAEKDVNQTGKSIDKETKDWKKSFTDVGKTMAIAGAAITTTMGLMIKSFASTGSELHDMSLKTGISAKSLAGLKYATEQNGASLGNIQIAVRTLANTMNDASDGMETANRSFKKLNLSVNELKGLKPEEQFLKIASAIADVEDPMQRSALAVDMFGRSGTELLPMLSEGADGLKKMMEEGVKLSGWTDEGANSADALGDSLDKLKASMSGVFNTIGSALAPAITNLVNEVSDIIVKVRDWAKEHPDLTRILATFTTGLGVTLTTLGGLLLIIPRLVTGFTGLSKALKAVGISAKAAWSALLLIPIAIEAIIAVYGKLSSQWDEKVLNPQEIGWAKIEQGVKRADGTLQKYGDTTKVYTMEQAQRYKALGYAVELYAGKVEDTTEDVIKSYEDEAKAAEEKAKELEWVTNAIQLAANKEMSIARNTHKYKMGLLEEEYKEKIKTANAESDAAIQAIQDQIDKLDNQTEEESRILQDQENQERLKELEYRMMKAETDEEYEQAEKDYQDLLAQINRESLLRQREDLKDSLQKQIDQIREDAQVREDDLRDELDKRKIALDEDLDNELARIDVATKALEIAYGIREADTQVHISKMQEIIDSLRDKIVNVDIITHEITEYSSVNESRYATEPERTGNYVGAFASGGVVPGIAGQPYLATVHGGETIIPTNESRDNMGNVVVNFTQPVFFDREDTMNRFVDMISKGIDRKQRLKFGGAYAG